MNDIVIKFLLAGDKFILEMHLKHPRFTYRACESFTKTKKRIENYLSTGNTNYIYRNELDKACFQHDIADGGFKDLEKEQLLIKF